MDEQEIGRIENPRLVSYIKSFDAEIAASLERIAAAQERQADALERLALAVRDGMIRVVGGAV